MDLEDCKQYVLFSEDLSVEVIDLHRVRQLKPLRRHLSGRRHLSPDGGGLSNPTPTAAWHRILKNRGNEGLRLRIDEPAPWFSTDPAMYNRKKK